MSDKLWQPQLKVKSPFSLLYLSHAHYTPRCEDVWWNKQQTEEFVVLRTASVVSICSWWCTVLKIYRLKAWICKVMFTTICLFGLYYILCAKLKLVLRAAHEVGRLIYLFLSSLHGAYALVRVRHEKHLVRVRGKSYFGYPVLVGTITYRNGPISCDGCNKNTWKIPWWPWKIFGSAIQTLEIGGPLSWIKRFWYSLSSIACAEWRKKKRADFVFE